MDDNQPASIGDMGSSPGPARVPKAECSGAREPQSLSLSAAAAEARVPLPCTETPRDEKPADFSEE